MSIVDPRPRKLPPSPYFFYSYSLPSRLWETKSIEQLWLTSIVFESPSQRVSRIPLPPGASRTTSPPRLFTSGAPVSYSLSPSMTSLSSSVRLYFSLFLLTLTTEKIYVTKTVPCTSFLSLDPFILSISLVFLTMFAHIGYRNNYRSTFFWHLKLDTIMDIFSASIISVLTSALADRNVVRIPLSRSASTDRNDPCSR